MTFTGGTSPATLVKIISVDFSGSTPPAPADYKAGAKITTASGFNATWSGAFKFVGFSEVSASGATAASMLLNGGVYTDIEFGADAMVSIQSTAAGSQLGAAVAGSYSMRLAMRDVAGRAPASRAGKLFFNNVAQTLTFAGGRLDLKNMLMLATGSKIPTSLFTMSMTRPVALDAEDVDFSGLDGTASLINATGTAFALTASFRECLIPSSVTLLKAGSVLAPSSRIGFLRCSTAAGGLSNRVVAYEGGQAEDTIVTLQGGATDNVALRSWHLTATATATLAAPYEANPILIANDQTGTALTVAIEGLWNGTSAPSNADVWIEVEAVTGDASHPSLGTIASTGLANDLAMPVAYPASTATWNSQPANTTKFRMSAAITPTQAELLKVIVKLAKASADGWIDPKPVVAGGPAVSRSSVTPSGAMMNETSSVTQGPSVTVYVPVPGRRSAR